MAYRPVPWKRNYLKIPADVRDALEAIKSDLIVVAATKKIPVRDIEAGTYAHVGLHHTVEGVPTSEPVLPPTDAGKWSKRNAIGWDRKRPDWPMVTKTYTFETPNFGDAATYGTHMHVRERRVYQRHVFEPKGMQVESGILMSCSNYYLIAKF